MAADGTRRGSRERDSDLERLGRPISREDRGILLDRLARPGAAEVVRPLVRSMFGRPRTDARLLIAALQRIATGEAAYALSRLSLLHGDERVRSEATRALSEVTPPTVASSDLYWFLVQSPREIARSADGLAPDVRRRLIADAERALETLEGGPSSDYVLALRRSLNDLPLLLRAGGPGEDIAFRRFSQRSNLTPYDHEVLDAIVPERRSAFISSSLSGKEPERALASLEALIRHGGSADDIAAAEQWLDNPRTAVAAVRAILARGDGDLIVRLTLIDRIRTFGRAVQGAAADALIDYSENPTDLPIHWSRDAEMRTLFLARAQIDPIRGDRLASILRQKLDESPDADEITEVLLALHRIAPSSFTMSDADHYLRSIQRIVRSSRAERPGATQVARACAVEAVRDALWASMPPLLSSAGTIGQRRFSRVVIAELAGASDPEDGGRRLGRLLSETPSVAEIAVDLAHEGSVGFDAFVAALDPSVEETVRAAVQAIHDADASEMARLGEVQETEDRRAREDLSERILPAIEAARTAARGNEALQRHYATMQELLHDLAAVRTPEPSTGTEGSAATPGAEATLQGLVTIDAAVRRGPDERARARVDAWTAGAGPSGLAASLITQLFEGGPEGRALIRLEPFTRVNHGRKLTP